MRTINYIQDKNEWYPSIKELKDQSPNTVSRKLIDSAKVKVMLTGPVSEFKAFRNELMLGKKGRLTDHKLIKEKLENEKINNLKSY